MCALRMRVIMITRACVRLWLCIRGCVNTLRARMLVPHQEVDEHGQHFVDHAHNGVGGGRGLVAVRVKR